MTQHKQSHRIKWHDQHIKWHDMTCHVATNHSSSPHATSQPSTLLHLTPQATSWHQNRSHHHHGTAEGSFTAKRWFSIGKFFLWLIVFFFETSAPGLSGHYWYFAWYPCTAESWSNTLSDLLPGWHSFEGPRLVRTEEVPACRWPRESIWESQILKPKSYMEDGILVFWVLQLAKCDGSLWYLWYLGLHPTDLHKRNASMSRVTSVSAMQTLISSKDQKSCSRFCYIMFMYCCIIC